MNKFQSQYCSTFLKNLLLIGPQPFSGMFVSRVRNVDGLVRFTLDCGSELEVEGCNVSRTTLQMEGVDTSSPNTGQRAPPTNGRYIERSCILCHRRKIKCNKQLPCATCNRLGVLCCYPSGEKHEPRKSRTTISDIVNRLGQLERTIVAISSSDNQSTNNGSVHSAEEPPSPDQDSEATTVSKEGMLLHDGYSGQYVNDILLSRVLEEVCFMYFWDERSGR